MKFAKIRKKNPSEEFRCPPYLLTKIVDDESQPKTNFSLEANSLLIILSSRIITTTDCSDSFVKVCSPKLKTTGYIEKVLISEIEK